METDRLYIELANSSHAQDLHTYYNSDFVQQYNVMAPLTLEGYEASLNVQDPHHIQHHLILKDTEKAIGNISLSTDRIRYGTHSITMSYWLAEPYTHKGYMSEALRTMIEFLLHETDYRIISCRVFAENEASIKLLQKLGFTQEGYLKQAVKDLRGITHDDILFAYFK